MELGEAYNFAGQAVAMLMFVSTGQLSPAVYLAKELRDQIPQVREVAQSTESGELYRAIGKVEAIIKHLHIV